MVSGRSMENGALIRSALRAEVAFPLSNHWGYDEISEYLNVSRPENVIIRGNFSDSLTNGLKKDGWSVTELKKPHQLTLF